MTRIFQYLLRVANVVLFAFPWNYQNRKLQIMTEMYQLSVDLLSQSGEHFWLDFGTLLGQYRHDDFIPHDIDIDVAMMDSSYVKICELKTCMPRGLRFYDTSLKHKGPKIYFSYKGYDFDIFFYKQTGNKIKCFLEGALPNETQSIDKNLVFPLNKVKFKGKDVKIPKHTKEYLQSMYGYLGTGGSRNMETGLWQVS